MPLAIQCPSCGYSKSVPDELAGKRGKCPKCGTQIRVPSLPPAPEPEPPAVGSARRSDLEPPGQRELLPKSDPSWDSEIFSEISAATNEPRPTSERRRGSARKEASASASEAEQARPSRRRQVKSQSRWRNPALIAIGVVSVCVVGASAYLLTRPEAPPANVATSKPNAAASSTKDRADAKPGPNADLADIFAYVKPGIVLIEIFNNGQQQGMGSGFVVDKSGLIVTNYHVVSPGNVAYVLLVDEKRYEVEGYVAVKPEWDLAIIKLKNPPDNLRVLEMVYDKRPREASNVMAVGSPLGHAFVPTSGIVGRVVQATSLPASAHSFVLEETGHDEQFWIEHNAQIAPGNSGGPLFNYRGEVIGINSWVDGEVRFGYAIWAWYAHNMLEHPLPQIAALSKYRKAELSPDDAIAGGDLSPAGLQKLFDEGAAMNWQPNSTGDYLRLQELARALTVARHGTKLGLPKDAAAKAQELSAKLAGMAWSADDQKKVNQFASRELSKPMGGTFLFATIKDKQTSPRGSVLMFNLVDSSQAVCAPGSGVDAGLTEGTTCLVLGHLSAKRMVYATPSDGRLEAAVIDAPIILPVGK